jgi:thiopurine S-methyltransferase
MDRAFWEERWRSNRIGFHQAEPHPMLTNNLEHLSLKENGRVFVPLCGKTVDIPWLLSQGYRVAGAELSQLAVDQLFASLHETPEITRIGKLARYSAPGVDIFQGDIFEMTSEILGRVDAVFDRAALVALPPEMRPRYAEQLSAISGHAPQLLITFEYDQSLMAGPPFSVPEEEVRRFYGTNYELRLLHDGPPAGGLGRLDEVSEKAWLISPAG